MKNKIKKISIISGIIFFTIIGLLTYFSSTIEYMLLPRVSAAYIESGTISGDIPDESGVCLVPISSVIEEDGYAEIFIVYPNDDNIGYAEALAVKVRNKNNMYCEIKLDPAFSGYYVIYETSRNLVNGDKVVVGC